MGNEENKEKKEKDKKRGSIRRNHLAMTIIPIIIMGAVICIASYNYLVKFLHEEVLEGMETTAYVISNTLDRFYPGDYSLARSDTLVGLMKGDTLLDEDFFESLKEDTDNDLTIFYGDIRYVTTVIDAEGKSMQGTKISTVVKKAVMEEDSAGFYRNVSIGDRLYFAYYLPLHDSGGTVVGMLGVLKRSEAVKSMAVGYVAPCLIIVVVSTILAALAAALYSSRLIKVIDKLRLYLIRVKNGQLNTSVDFSVSGRNDELGEMAKAVDDMRRSIRQSVEMDALTGLYNRRYGSNQLNSICEHFQKHEQKFAVSIGDIDFFKKVNDTYGHDAGDLVLRNVSLCLKRYMTGKGFVARWGGEEFLLVFDNADIETASRRLWELLGQVRELSLPYGDEIIKVTMSFGVADGSGLDAETVLKAADRRVYLAKEGGRNRVVSEDC